jgi:hypothetical protein
MVGNYFSNNGVGASPLHHTMGDQNKCANWNLNVVEKNDDDGATTTTEQRRKRPPHWRGGTLGCAAGTIRRGNANAMETTAYDNDDATGTGARCFRHNHRDAMVVVAAVACAASESATAAVVVLGAIYMTIRFFFSTEWQSNKINFQKGTHLSVNSRHNINNIRNKLQQRRRRHQHQL